MEGNVCVIGLGLIGGSIALTIKQEHHVLIKGYDSNLERAKLAKSLKVIDQYGESLREAVIEADLIVIAVPVTETVKIIKKLAQLPLKEGVIITDVGSTKSNIVSFANETLPNQTFIGGHPMAGSHKSGVEASNTLLFENAYYVLTPTNGVKKKDVSMLKVWLEGTRAKFIEMDAEQHDHVAGVISHFPHIIASSLVKHAQFYNQSNPVITDLAAGGFRDITRIASSNPKMWTDILLHNRKAILELFDEWFNQMMDIRSQIDNGSIDEIQQFFYEAKTFRDGLSPKQKGAIPSYYDLFVDVPDYPGVIAEITGLLAEHEISITNIEIIETREDIYGVLRISFRNDKNRLKAKLLIENHYETFILS